MQRLCKQGITRVKANTIKITKAKGTREKGIKVKGTKEMVHKVDTKIMMVKKIKATKTPTTNQGEIIVETIEEIFPHEETD